MTQGNHVYLKSGQEKFLEHELGHVIQQKQGRVTPDSFDKGIALNTSKRLEKEADIFAETVDSGIKHSDKTVHLSYESSPVIQLASDDEDEEIVLPDDYLTLPDQAADLLNTPWTTENFASILNDYNETLQLYDQFHEQYHVWTLNLKNSYDLLKTEYIYLSELLNTANKYEQVSTTITSLSASLQTYFGYFRADNYLISYGIDANNTAAINAFKLLLHSARNSIKQNDPYVKKINVLLINQHTGNNRLDPQYHENQHNRIRLRLDRINVIFNNTQLNLAQQWTLLKAGLTNSAINCVSTLIQNEITAGELDLNPAKVSNLATLIVKDRKHKLTTTNTLITNAINAKHLIAPNIWAASLLPARGNAYGNPCGNLIVSPHKQIPVHNTLYTTNVPDISVKRPGISDAVITSDIQNTLLGNGVDAFHVTAEAHGAISTNNPHAYRGGTVLTKWAAGSPTTKDQLDPLSQDEFINKIKPIRDTEVSSIELLLKSKIEEQRNKYLNIVEERLKATHV